MDMRFLSFEIILVKIIDIGGGAAAQFFSRRLSVGR